MQIAYVSNKSFQIKVFATGHAFRHGGGGGGTCEGQQGQKPKVRVDSVRKKIKV